MLSTTFTCFFLCSLALSFTAVSSTAASNATKIYGTNLGGWFVMERFLKPSLYASAEDPRVVDQWTFCLYTKNVSSKANLLKEHWETWVTKSDIQELAEYGITHLRIPIGYWMLMTQEELDHYNEPFIHGSWPYLERAIAWAKNYSMKVVIDLHAAPGSQNGWEHSGRRGATMWGQGDTINRTLAIIERIALKVKSYKHNATLNDTVVAIDVLNEPVPWTVHGGFNTIKSYFALAYKTIRKHLPHLSVVFSEAFTPWNTWNSVLKAPNYTNVIIDLHTYHCFDDGLRSLPLNEHVKLACKQFGDKVRNHNHTTWTGEWSLAYKETDSGSINETYPATLEEKVGLRRFSMAQRSSYEGGNGLGWFFWNFKSENAIMWNLLEGIRGGWLPHRQPENVGIVCVNATDTSTVTKTYLQ
jgi:glucan 1,3-beta-glucosidase